MYCGNNRNSIELRTRRQVIGNRYGCLRKGIGVGLHVLPLDLSYNDEYVPIDNRKIYCGREDNLPANYNILGTNDMCFRKGVGVGKKLKVRKSRKKSKRKSKRKSRKKSKRKSRKKSKRKKSKRKSKRKKSKK